ncbi:quinone-dependent dihydroorotate dehydrogenase [Hyphomonas johnsonii]|uniref:Dihydroorotate dehydrogenase (quinone) n=1 Tax=Hyphomonas johnsonii MHS-2 TaxID=1280950 RepID=A0A059FNA6_9PROT|nr:quinone-dependent dihydroorotate dehydrogenase [Hyphomonas johnsonii]KCZ92082.1 dihydroorotate oxidase [Hyphomonas johnsonii MHS-2]
MGLIGMGVAAVRMLPPEAAHSATISALKRGLGVPLRTPAIDPSLSVTLPRSGLTLAGPVGLAAGFDKNCEVPAAMARFGFGFVECGTVTPLPQPGNPKPRLFRLSEDGAVINRMGFNNYGLAYFVRRLKAYRGTAPIGANVGANKESQDRIADYVRGIEAVSPHADYVTVNISSPNTPGLRGLQDKGALQSLLAACGAADRAGKPVFLKVAPDLDRSAIADIVGVVRKEGAWLAGLIVSNTTLARPDTLTSRDKGEAGGLSGAPLMAPSTRVLAAFAAELRGEFDLIGAGGIASAADAYAKIKAGAHAVQLYSALVYSGPGLVAQIHEDLPALLAADGFTRLAEAVGTGL